jgi:hypothetical protein
VDLDSTLLTTSLHRMLRRVAGRDPAMPVLFTEMLPGPDECWLEHDGARYTSELRLVAVDLSRRGAGRVALPGQAPPARTWLTSPGTPAGSPRTAQAALAGCLSSADDPA